MSIDQQVRLIITPLPHLIAWEIRDDERRLGHGSELAGDWQAIRNVEVRAGVARVDINPQFIDDAGRAAALDFGWGISAT
jgi:hypothetical protein